MVGGGWFEAVQGDGDGYFFFARGQGRVGDRDAGAVGGAAFGVGGGVVFQPPGRFGAERIEAGVEGGVVGGELGGPLGFDPDGGAGGEGRVFAVGGAFFPFCRAGGVFPVGGEEAEVVGGVGDQLFEVGLDRFGVEAFGPQRLDGVLSP